MKYQNSSKWGETTAHKRGYADGGSVGVGEKIARFMSNGRDEGQRKLYNSTRAGLFNEDTPPDEASPMGGLGRSLKSRRTSDMYEAQSISDAVPRRKD